MTMKILRDLRLSTKMLVLFELINDPKTRLKALAIKLDMTVQGVSEYIHLMELDGLIKKQDQGYRVTRSGVQMLHDSITELRDFVVEAVNRLEIIRTCSAIAMNQIRKGQMVGLFMEDGTLTAYASKPSQSTGIAMSDAKRGDDILVEDLEGVVELKPGRLVIIEINPEMDSRSRTTTDVKAGRIFKESKFRRLGALDAVGFAAISRYGLKCDFEFAAASAGIEAAQKGLDVALLGGPDEVHRFIKSIENMNSRSLQRIGYELILLK
jgi:putative transcriptional regulator